jgi:type IV pilus assembly protein PilE
MMVNLQSPNKILGSIMKKQAGFTLIELMITVAIIAILASIAYPSYLEQVTKTRRADGKAKLMEIMQAQEREYTLNYSYVTNLASLGYTLSDGKVESNEGYYAISAAACGSGIGSCVQLTATALGSQSSDGNLTLDSIGNKTPADKW